MYSQAANHYRSQLPFQRIRKLPTGLSRTNTSFVAHLSITNDRMAILKIKHRMTSRWTSCRNCTATLRCHKPIPIADITSPIAAPQSSWPPHVCLYRHPNYLDSAWIHNLLCQCPHITNGVAPLGNAFPGSFPIWSRSRTILLQPHFAL